MYTEVKKDGEKMDLNDERRIFGRNLYTLIQKRNWSMRRAADEIGYGRNDFSGIINGTKNFQLKTAVKIAKFFDVSLFLMFSRQFDVKEYRERFLFIETDYMNVFVENFNRKSLKRSRVELDAATLSKILNGKYKNPTIKTLETICLDNGVVLSELLKTSQDKNIEKKEIVL